MENLVGQVVPSDKEVEALVRELGSIDGKVARFVDVHLTAAERGHMLRMRPGGERILPLLSRLVAERGVQIPGASAADMEADRGLAERLRVLESATQALLQRIQDGRAQAETECWSAATAFYSVLLSMAARDPQLRTALAPAIELFATGRRRKTT